MRAIALLMLVGCGGKPEEPAACTCKPGNVARSKTVGEAAPMTGESLLAALRRHKQDIALGKNPRDIKIVDDQLRFQIIDFCQPCAGWVDDRMTMEQMFPLDRIDEARSAVCMGLVLGDGSTIYGDTRPLACR
ncbi:MAG: hypothetical protein H0V17_06875 [Deltaproteobacteria bacterium]|nr:hypothetical protein [Deltaproteobacteria bacterium]